MKRLLEELEPFFGLSRAFIQMNLYHYELEDLLTSSNATEEEIEKNQIALTEAQRSVDALLYPSRPAKLLRQRLTDLNERFCAPPENFH